MADYFTFDVILVAYFIDWEITIENPEINIENPEIIIENPEITIENPEITI